MGLLRVVKALRCRARLGMFVGLALGAVACGPFEELPSEYDGPPCASDSECVPDGCCGTGTGVVHISEAPNCTASRCSNECPVNQVRCGCGYPVCRDGRCVVAVAVGGGC